MAYLAQPKAQESVNTVVQPREGKMSASSAGINQSEDFQIVAKIPRFVLDVPTSSAVFVF